MKQMQLQKKTFKLFKNRYQNNLESTKGDFVFDYVHPFYHKYHKINPNCGTSYIDSPDSIKNKATINPINIYLIISDGEG